MQIGRSEASPWDSDEETHSEEADLPVIMVTEETGGESFVRLRDNGWVACAHGFDTPEISALERPDNTTASSSSAWHAVEALLPLPEAEFSIEKRVTQSGELLSIPCERFSGVNDFEQPLGRCGVVRIPASHRAAPKLVAVAEPTSPTPETPPQGVVTPPEVLATPPRKPHTPSVSPGGWSAASQKSVRSVETPCSADTSLSLDATRLTRPKPGAALHLVRKQQAVSVYGETPPRREASMTATPSPAKVPHLRSPGAGSTGGVRGSPYKSTPVSSTRARRLF